MTALDGLHAQHEACDAAQGRSNIRMRARELAAQLGVPMPDWARHRKPSRKNCKRSRAQSPMPVRRRARPARAQAPGVHIAPAALEALRAWRERTPGSVVQITHKGVVLHTLAGKRTFRDMAAAVAAVA
jgi:hypothetical protein